MGQSQDGNGGGRGHACGRTNMITLCKRSRYTVRPPRISTGKNDFCTLRTVRAGEWKVRYEFSPGDLRRAPLMRTRWRTSAATPDGSKDLRHFNIQKHRRQPVRTYAKQEPKDTMTGRQSSGTRFCRIFTPWVKTCGALGAGYWLNILGVS